MRVKVYWNQNTSVTVSSIRMYNHLEYYLKGDS